MQKFRADVTAAPLVYALMDKVELGSILGFCRTPNFFLGLSPAQRAAEVFL